MFSRFYFRGKTIHEWTSYRLPMFRDILRVVRQLGAKSVYDVGTAGGGLLAYLYTHGIRVDGCDVSESAINASPVRVTRGTVRELQPRGFDVLTNLDTLYYVDDPLSELQAARQCSRYLILRLRTNRHAVAQCKSGGWPGAADHLWAFTPRTAKMLVERAGYTVLRIMPASYARRYYWRSVPLNALTRVGQILHAPPFGLSFLLIARS
jgi:hypothetical protein